MPARTAPAPEGDKHDPFIASIVRIQASGIRCLANDVDQRRQPRPLRRFALQVMKWHVAATLLALPSQRTIDPHQKGAAAMPEQHAQFEGSIPEFYDRHLGPVLFHDYADDLADRLAALGPARVLELAAGTGIATRRLRDRLPSEAEIVATDLNQPMLDHAEAKFDAGEAVEFQPADASALPFGDASFEAVVCQYGIMFFPDKSKCLAEVMRVLRFTNSTI